MKTVTRLLCVVGCLGLLSCSAEVLDVAPEPIAESPPSAYAPHDFDGRWVWIENGKQLYHLTISDGQVLSVLPADRQAKHVRYQRAVHDVDPLFGLSSISLRNDIHDNQAKSAAGIVEYTRFVFDEPVSGHTPEDTICAGATSSRSIPGLRCIEMIHPRDEVRFRTLSKPGTLKWIARCDF